MALQQVTENYTISGVHGLFTNGFLVVSIREGETAQDTVNRFNRFDVRYQLVVEGKPRHKEASQ